MPGPRLSGGFLYMKRHVLGGKRERKGVKGCGMWLFHAGFISCLFEELIRPVFICEN